MDKILVAVDGSEPSMRAVALAAELAAKQGATLTLVAVVRQLERLDPALSAYAESEHIRSPGVELPLAAADNMLERARERATKAGAKRIAVDAPMGDPAEQIIDAAAAHKADLVVLGTRGHGRLRGLLVGSVAQKVVSHAPSPVLVVR